MQHGDLERLVREVDAGDRGALRRHGFGENAAAAAHVENALSRERSGEALDVREP